MIGLLATGAIMTFMGAGKGYFDAATLTVKHTAVLMLIIVGLNITFRVLPKLKTLAPKSHEAKPRQEFLKASTEMKANSIIGLILWYAIIALSAIL